MAPIAVNPVLHTTTLPMPASEGQVEKTFYKGRVERMANGNLVRDNVSNSPKLRFTIAWEMLTATERNTVMTALATVADGTSRSYTSIRNLTYTVVLAEDGEPEWEIVPVKANSEFRYSGALVLEEV